MEESKIIKRVGNYSTSQASPGDCVKCHKAKFGTMIIDGVCLDCYEGKILERDIITKLLEIAIPSLDPNNFEQLEDIIDELRITRHIPKESAKKEKVPIGMYGETPRVQIGKYSISKQDENSIWVEHESGEGSAFKEDLLEKHIDDFYKRHF